MTDEQIRQIIRILEAELLRRWHERARDLRPSRTGEDNEDTGVSSQETTPTASVVSWVHNRHNLKPKAKEDGSEGLGSNPSRGVERARQERQEDKG